MIAVFLLTLLLAAQTLLAEPPAATFVRPSTIYALSTQAPALDTTVLKLALRAHRCAVSGSKPSRSDVLTIIDYSRPSTEPRLWVVDTAQQRVLYEELVSHGQNTGGNLATDFSNKNGSHQTSLGLFLTANTYSGRNGYSLRLRGLEEGVNDNAWERAIVMHGAPYVSASFAQHRGRLGRSWGCPAVRKEIAKPLIDTIKDGSFVFAYYPNSDWLETSDYLDGEACPN